MSKNLYLISIGSLIIGFAGGYLVSDSTQTFKIAPYPDIEYYEPSIPTQKSAQTKPMKHDKYNLPDPENAPTVELNVTKDKKSGYNVFINTTNFTFTPEKVGQEHVENEGHAHLYVNGEKIARVYGSWYHISSLNAGENEINVTLNTNDHKDYAIDGNTIEDTLIMDVTEAEANQTTHTH